MAIKYRVDGEYFEYEIDNEEYQRAIHKILKEETKESLIDIIISSDMCQLDLSDMLEDELRCYFEDRAYKEYLDRRYE